MENNYQEVIQKLIGYMDNTVVFAKEQLPDIANQMLAYGELKAWIALAVFASLSAFTLLITIWVAKSDDGDNGGPTAVLFVIFLALIAGTVDNGFAIIKIHTAPKLYIMDELADKIHK